MHISTTEIPRIKAASVQQLGLSLAHNALRAPVRTPISDTAARVVCRSVLEGLNKLSLQAPYHFLFKESFFARNGSGRRVINGAPVYRQALLDVLGNRHAPSRKPVHERTKTDPRTNQPHRHSEWYGAGLLHVAGMDEIIVLEGKTQRWQTSPREGWVDYFQFGALAPLAQLDSGTRSFRKLDIDVYDTSDILPTDKVHIGNIWTE